MKELWRLFATREFTLWDREINRDNRLAIHTLAVAGLLMGLANIFAQNLFVLRKAFSFRTTWLLFYFVCLWAFERFVMPKDCYRSTLLLYLLEAPPMVVAILLGTVWDPSHQALTILMFLTVMPVFIFDRPQRVLGISAAWAGLFLLLCVTVKDPSTLRGDVFHTLEFYLASAAVTLVVLRVRLEALRNFALTRYHLEHDARTGLLNRLSLEDRLAGYAGKPLFVLFASLDLLERYNDFYGPNTGDQMIKCLAAALCDQFGSEYTFRYGGDGFACVAIGISEEELLFRLTWTRKQLRHRKFNGHTLSLSCSAGYASATPETAQDVRNLLRLADIYCHRARRAGEGQTIGGPYDELQLRSAITDSRISSQAEKAGQNANLLTFPVFIARAAELWQGRTMELDKQPMLGFFHITHFRDFNEEFGYAKGDALINHTTKLLSEAFPNRYICNITAAQFGMICYQEEIAPGVEQTAEGLRQYQPDYPIVVKAGFVEFGEKESVISLLDKAKAAHDAIYNKPDAAWCLYDKKMDAENQFRQYLVSHLDEALEKGWIQVYYQPIVRAFTGCICNEEALSRWDDPAYGFLSPFQFIPVLEENRLIYKLSLYIVRRILEDFRRKEARGITPVPVSVNLSRFDFEECDMVQSITDLVDQAGYSRSMIRIEITESAAMNNQALLVREVSRFHENGFEVWMDDFGSEYSTLNLLQNLNFDLIKVDMEFMKNFTVSGKNMIIVSNILNMAQRMGVQTLVEGIETEEHVRLLRKLGCEKLQGFLFSKPVSLDYLLDWTRSGESIRYESDAEAAYFDAIGRVDLSAPPVPGSTGTENGGETGTAENANGTGVTVEAGDGTGETVETVDRTGGAMETGENLSATAPAGVVEYRQNQFICLRGNDSFFLALQDTGLLAAERMGTGLQALTSPPPQTLVKAAALAGVLGNWVTVERGDDWKRWNENADLLLRRVAHNADTDSTAFLMVFLPHLQ